jgi:hypothetical protein
MRLRSKGFLLMCAIVPALILAQQGPAPGAQAPGGRGAALGGAARGGGRGWPQYQLEKGKPIDTRAATRPTITRCGKTRRTYYETAVWAIVTTITDKLVAPWSIAFLPGAKCW